MMNTNHWLHKRNVLNGSKTFLGAIKSILFRYGFRLVELLRDRYMLLERLCHLCAHGCVRLRKAIFPKVGVRGVRVDAHGSDHHAAHTAEFL